ncbi:MAG: hypothetical protein NZ521_05620, partial [Flammeovirgaceae bacterium]|nr:hypothetical protein [Flammeovirgaceae bacterium]MDW8287717.1 hypothetical protein [Flammeovirgaceae bacterium]
MKTKRITFLTIVSVIVSFFGFSLLNKDYAILNNGNDISKNKVIEQLLFHGIAQAHYNPMTFDDQLSEKAFYAYLKKLDPTKHYFLEEDIEQLKVYRFQLDDEVRGADVPLYTQATTLWRKRIEEAKGYCQELLKTPFNFSTKEFVELDPEKRTFAKTKDELKEEWRKFLKYSALTRYYSRIETQKQQEEEAKKNKKPFTSKSLEEISKEVTEQLLKDYNDRFDYLEKLDEEDLYGDYMNALVGVYCPHTEFFPPQKKENFD